MKKETGVPLNMYINSNPERERERESRLKNAWNGGRRSSECRKKGFVRRSESGLYRGSRRFTVSACVKLPRYA